jgi:hypothetical protein
LEKEEYACEVEAMCNTGDPKGEGACLLQAMTNSMNDRHACEAPLSIGIAWLASDLDRLIDLTAGE